MITMMKRKLLARPLAILIAVLVAFTFMPMLPGGAGNDNEAYAAGPAELYSNYLQVIIDGTPAWQDLAQSDSENGWDWNHTTRTLTIGADFSFLCSDGSDDISIKFDAPAGAAGIKIKLNGNVSIESNTALQNVIQSNTDLELDLNGYWLNVVSTNGKRPLAVLNANLNIIDSRDSTGLGRLDLISNSDGVFNPGLYVEDGSVTIEVGESTVNIASVFNLFAVMASNGFVLNSGNVTVGNTVGRGIVTGGDVIINDGELEIVAKTTAINTTENDLIVNGGFLNADSDNGNVIETGSIAINGGHVVAPQHILTNPDNNTKKTISGGGILETGNTIGSFTFTDGIFSYNDGGDHEITVRGSHAVWPINLPIESSDQLTIEAGATLTIPESVNLLLEGWMINMGTVINNGDIDIVNQTGTGGKIQNYYGSDPYFSGTFINNGSIDIDGSYSEPAQILNSESAALSGVFQNNGTIENGGRIVNEYGSFENSSSGTLTNKSGAEILNSSGEIINSGTLTNETGATIDNSGDGTIYNSGTIDGAGAGSITVTDTNLANIATIDAIPAQTYADKALTPAVTVKKTGDIALAKDTDYEVNYSNNINAGTATITVTGKGIYGGSKQATFTINKADISALIPTDIADQIHSGNAITPALTITYNGKTLVAGTDYDAVYTNNVNVGTASVAITGKGNFTGTKTASFNIIAAKQNEDSSQQTDGLIDLATFNTNAKASAANRIAVADKAWTGKALKSGFAITAGGKKLKAGTDYTITANGSNKDIGKGSVTIKGTGNYKGTKVLSFKITPKKGTIKKLAVGKKSITVKWSKLSTTQKITGYKVEYKIKGATKWKMQTVSAKKTSLVIKGLTKGKKYQVRIYAYKTIKSGASKGTYNAPYSAVKTSAKVK